MRLLLLAAAATLATSSLAASADTFTFSYSTATATASGAFDATNQGDGNYLVTSLTGTRNGVAISSLDATRTFGENDNILSPAIPTLVDFQGISYMTVDGAQFNIYASATGLRETVTGFDDGTLVTDGSLQLAPVPEPSCLALLGSGTLAAAGTVRRRVRR